MSFESIWMRRQKLHWLSRSVQWHPRLQWQHWRNELWWMWCRYIPVSWLHSRRNSVKRMQSLNCCNLIVVREVANVSTTINGVTDRLTVSMDLTNMSAVSFFRIQCNSAKLTKSQEKHYEVWLLSLVTAFSITFGFYFVFDALTDTLKIFLPFHVWIGLFLLSCKPHNQYTNTKLSRHVFIIISWEPTRRRERLFRWRMEVWQRWMYQSGIRLRLSTRLRRRIWWIRRLLHKSNHYQGTRL